MNIKNSAKSVLQLLTTMKYPPSQHKNVRRLLSRLLPFVLLLPVLGCGGTGGPGYPAGSVLGTHYVLIPLAPLPADFQVAPTRINNLGQISGGSYSGQPFPPGPAATRLDLKRAAPAPDLTNHANSYYVQAVLYTNLTPQRLGIAQNWSSTAAVNNNGQAVVNAENINGPPPASKTTFLWQGGTLTQLNAMSEVDGINDAGQIVGVGANNHAALWQHGAVSDLGTLGGSASSHANAINQSGVIVGGAGLNYGEAAMWVNGAVTDLGKLPGCIGSEAWAINDTGDIVGQSSFLTAPPASHACLWHNGTITDLDPDPTLGYSQALSINNNGDIVGTGNMPVEDLLANFQQRALLWRNGVKRDLNSEFPADSGWILTAATSINAQGQIVGVGNKGGFLLTPR